MCGIVGIVSHNPVANILLKTLRRMEYRGYDSAGIGLVDKSNPLHIHKVIGSASGLSDLIKDDKSLVGIAHTRWATHGKPELRNAHPFKCGGVAIVHNGIIENHQELKDVLISQGHSFDSSTDSEVISHIFHDELKENSPIEALRNTCSMLKGAWAIGIVMETHPNMLLVARKGSPIIVAQGPSGNAIASDPTSLGGLFHEFYRLEDGDIAVLTLKNITIYNQDGLLKNDVIWSLLDNAYQDDVQGAYESFTRREISQQPESLHKTNDYLNERVIPEKFLSVDRVTFIACGSSLYAASIARQWFEYVARIPCDIEVASEFRYRDAPVSPNSVAVMISQSGETADTMAALEVMKSNQVLTIGVVNVEESSIGHACDLLWPTKAGQETGVAATKTFTSQVLAVIRLGMAFADLKISHLKQSGNMDLANLLSARKSELEEALSVAPDICADSEQVEHKIKMISERIALEHEALFIGRGWGASMSAEASLKLKELSYIPAAAYPAGELKHGPIALIREGTPVVVLIPSDDLFGKTLSNAEEVRSRGAYVIALTDREGAEKVRNTAHEIVVLPGHGAEAVFSHAVAIQLIAYHTAIALGRDVDRPRNLAKSVTVE